jgi:hypothetical protein
MVSTKYKMGTSKLHYLKHTEIKPKNISKCNNIHKCNKSFTNYCKKSCYGYSGLSSNNVSHLYQHSLHSANNNKEFFILLKKKPPLYPDAGVITDLENSTHDNYPNTPRQNFIDNTSEEVEDKYDQLVRDSFGYEKSERIRKKRNCILLKELESKHYFENQTRCYTNCKNYCRHNTFKKNVYKIE